MNELQIFNNDEFGQLKLIIINDEPWWIAKEVCNYFGIVNHRNILARLDDDEKGVHDVDTNGGRQKMSIINESGLYNLLFSMDPQNARGISEEEIQERISKIKRFKKWVTSEVLPSIRKTGAYGQQLPMTNEEKIKLLLESQGEVYERVRKVEESVTDMKGRIESAEDESRKARGAVVQVMRDMYLLPVEADMISNYVKSMGVNVLGGKNAKAYKNKSIRSKVYADIYHQIYRQYGVYSYKELQRKQIDGVMHLIETYDPPLVMKEQIIKINEEN